MDQSVGQASGGKYKLELLSKRQQKKLSLNKYAEYKKKERAYKNA